MKQEAGLEAEAAGVKPELEVKQEAGLEAEAAGVKHELEVKQEAELEAEVGAEKATPAKKPKIEKLSAWEKASARTR